jgi:feruloyl esterase
MGHKGSAEDVLWADNNLQAQIDFGYRATHVVAAAGKAITASYYRRSAHRSYFVGCSTGGYQGVTEAQRFPWDFNGILAGAPDINLGAANLRAIWIARVFLDEAGKPRLDHEALELVHSAALARCDRDDGVKDGIIGNPPACHFDPGDLVCKAGQTRKCLAVSQADTVRKLYAGPMTSKGQKTSTGGFLPGSELLWEEFWPPESTAQYFKYGMPGYSTGPQWKYTDFDFDRDYQRLGGTPWYDNDNPDLRKFKQAGGKLIVYHGWADTVDLPGAVTDYYEAVERAMGGRAATQSFFRLFMVPGMNHCTLGEGAFAVDWLGYLEAWVEDGHAPERIIGSHVKLEDVMDRVDHGDKDAWQMLEHRLEFPLDPATVEFSRPIYPYPTQVKYLGHGDLSDAASFGPLPANR